MHSDPPFAATLVVHLYGGPWDGNALLVPLHTHELHIPLDEEETQIASYHFCPARTAQRQRPIFRSADIAPLSNPE